MTDLRPLPHVQPVGAVIAAGAIYREQVLQLSVAHKLGRPDAMDAEIDAGSFSSRRQTDGY